MAFSLFSRIPMPRLDWDERNMRYMLAAFPLIGVVIGLLMWLWTLVASALNASAFLFGVVAVLVPVAVTGGIHLDGFADVVDAKASHAEPEKKLAILKDPHVGAFAIVGVCCALLLYAALAGELYADLLQTGMLSWGNPAAGALFAWFATFVASRAASGIATVSFPKNANQGMLAEFRKSASKRAVAVIDAIWFIAAVAFSLAASPLAGGLATIGALGTLAWLRAFSQRQFGGMSGDLAGWNTVVSELVMLACIVIGVKVGALWF